MRINPFPMNMQLKALGIAIFAASMISGCMTQAELDALNASLDLTPNDGVTIESPTVEPACFNERFVQPDAIISQSIDLLFVMDTSGSMSDNRAKVADGISAFVAELPAAVDYQVGIMLAHGSRSSWSGKLFKYNNVSIFSSKTMTVGAIQTQLRDMVLHAPWDAYGEQGEEGSYSLLKGITTNLALNQTAGFFRPDAALAVVFVSDENDICAPYVGHPEMQGLTYAEKTIRNRDCRDGIATNTVVSQIKALQGTRPYLFGGVVHKTAGYSDSSGNDGFGWGYMEIIQATQGVSTEINDGSYTQGLADMGKLATSKLTLILDFTLAQTDVDLTTIQAQVDGLDTPFTYDAVANDVHLSNGGGARSVVDIGYCLNTQAPDPTPSPTPTWTPPPN